jgi:hypothetical protein
LVKLETWETTSLAELKKAQTQKDEDDANETLAQWQEKLKAIDPSLTETIITQAVMDE